MNKPQKHKTEYYEWEELLEYLNKNFKFSDNSDVDIDELFYEKYEYDDEEFVYISNWEIVHDNGQFSYLNDPKWNEVIEFLTREFGEDDLQCLTPGNRTLTVKK